MTFANDFVFECATSYAKIAPPKRILITAGGPILVAATTDVRSASTQVKYSGKIGLSPDPFDDIGSLWVSLGVRVPADALHKDQNRRLC
jgi:hypothetical protein